jgi:outer membrane protein assembly factor BamB
MTLKLDADRLKQTWRIPLSPSYSGPIVSESMVFVTETQDKKTEVVRALDRGSGAQRWEASWEGSVSVPFFAKSNGDWIRRLPPTTANAYMSAECAMFWSVDA